MKGVYFRVILSKEKNRQKNCLNNCSLKNFVSIFAICEKHFRIQSKYIRRCSLHPCSTLCILQGSQRFENVTAELQTRLTNYPVYWIDLIFLESHKKF